MKQVDTLEAPSALL